MCKSCCFSKNKFLRYGPKAKLFLYPLRFLTSCLKIISTSVITPTEFKTSRSLETAWIVHHCMQFPHLKRMKTALICTHNFSYIQILESARKCAHRFPYLTAFWKSWDEHAPLLHAYLQCLEHFLETVFWLCIHFVIQYVDNRLKCATAVSYNAWAALKTRHQIVFCTDDMSPIQLVNNTMVA